MKSDKIREQQVPMESVYPITIPPDYRFIRTDLLYRTGSTLAYAAFGLTLGVGFLNIINRQRIYGRENIRPLKNKGFITVANHCHIFDTVLTGMALHPRKAWYASVQRNFEAPYYRKMFRILRGFPIPDGMFGLKQILKPVVTAIQQGKIVHFFPEEELWRLYQGIDHFQRGAFYLAHHANCPVVPIVHLFKPRTFFGRKISDGILSIKTVIGEPIYPKANQGQEDGVNLKSVQEMTDRAHDWMYLQMENYHQTGERKK